MKEYQHQNGLLLGFMLTLQDVQCFLVEVKARKTGYW